MEWIPDAWAYLHRLTNPIELNAIAGQTGLGLYAAFFAIVFCETGLVILPFLPGDSLLFAIGALGAISGTPIHLPWVVGLLIAAAILGDAVNYSIGKRLGPGVFHHEGGRWLNPRHLSAAHGFFERHGCKTIILARFIPIVRTFAPLVAGIGRMSYPRFALYNVVGAVLWVGLLVAAGRVFGGLKWVSANFEAVIGAIILISVLPAVFEILRARMKPRQALESIPVKDIEI